MLDLITQNCFYTPVMQTLSEIHDIDTTGAEWQDLREAMEELNRQNSKEAKRRAARWNNKKKTVK